MHTVLLLCEGENMLNNFFTIFPIFLGQSPVDWERKIVFHIKNCILAHIMEGGYQTEVIQRSVRYLNSVSGGSKEGMGYMPLDPRLNTVTKYTYESAHHVRQRM